MSDSESDERRGRKRSSRHHRDREDRDRHSDRKRRRRDRDRDRDRDKDRDRDRDKDKDRKKKSEPEVPGRLTRWDPSDRKTFLPGVPTYVPDNISGPEMEALLIRIRFEEITFKLVHQGYHMDLQERPGRERSPSPAPEYDKHGKRMNTRDVRIKTKLERERHTLVEKAYRINPMFKPPADYKNVSVKKTKKVFIPIDEFPDYNFIGLIIGPRGMTQKKMERESGAKISIRGKGSVKEGKVKAGRPQDDEDEDLHVLVTADTEKQLEVASMMIAKLLIPVEEGRNEHKRNQLRLLAEINGTLRETMFQPHTRTWRAPDVYCKHCGEISHATIDCPLKHAPVDKVKIDSEYNDFMSSIGETPMTAAASQAASKKTDATYSDFLNTIETIAEPKAPEQPPPPAQPSAAAPWAQSGAAPAPWQAQPAAPAPWHQAGAPQPPPPAQPPAPGQPQPPAPWTAQGATYYNQQNQQQ